uniref:Homeobox protein EgHBX4 n=1 Tax=Talaromyces marneffei PM1 TaxID=1077442 RepID=A0A093VFH9_TALMA
MACPEQRNINETAILTYFSNRRAKLPALE